MKVTAGASTRPTRLQTSEAIALGVRVDVPGGIQPGDAYARIRTKMTQSMTGNTGVPRTGQAFDPHDPLDALPPAESRAYPTTGHGITASRDKRLYPESFMKQNTNMPTENAVTVMEFRTSSGLPMQVTIGVQTASDWKLVQTGPDLYVWQPLIE